MQVVPPTEEELRDGKYSSITFNTVVAAQSTCPAVSLPAGFTDDGIPVGVELLSKPYGEPRLVELAYAYERAVDPRRPPETAQVTSGNEAGHRQ